MTTQWLWAGLGACIFFADPPPLNPEPPAPAPTGDTTVDTPGELRLTDVVPPFGRLAGGEAVTLSGVFPEDPRNLVVTFGSVVAPIESATATELVVLSPPSGQAGPVMVTVTEGARFSLRDGAFAYFADRSDRVGLIGIVRRDERVGGYWPADAVSDGRAELGFVDAHDWSLAEIYGTSGCTYLFDATVPVPVDTGAEALVLTTGPTSLPLEPLGTVGYFGATLNDADVAAGASFGLGPLAGGPDWPRLTVPDLVTIPPAFQVLLPDLDSATLPTVSQSFTVQWTGSGGDYMVLDLQREYLEGETWTLLDDVVCTVPDTGSFTVPASVWPDWYAQERVYIRLGRVVEASRSLPHDGSTTVVAGVYSVVGVAETL